MSRPVALVTGGSRGIGAAAAIGLAARGYDVAITYRNKAARAEEVAAAIREAGARALSLACDLTDEADLDRTFAALAEWGGRLDLLVLNAAGGLERELIAADPHYPMRINRDAQLATLDRALRIMGTGGTVVYVTSHWAHLWGQIEQLPAYVPVASTKHAGEMALRARQEVMAVRGIRLLIATGDLVEGTIAPRLLERTAPGLMAERRQTVGPLPTAESMGEDIAAAATDPALPSGHTVVIGGSLESVPRSQAAGSPAS